MLSIHDSDYCAALRARVDKLTPDAPRQWGVMNASQMVWHLNASLAIGLGKLRATPMSAPLPRALLTPLVLYLPFPKGKANAIPETIAPAECSLDTERARFHQLVEEFSLKPLHMSWLDHPILGPLSGPSWSRLQAKHADYHLRQFAV